MFVCGGNAEDSMRKRFKQYFDENLSDYEFFQPEFAMNNYFSDADVEQFDIADFEQLIGDLSHSIVLFPEAAGSFAETGYFSAIESLAKKTILALDSLRQDADSFISLGPAKKIQECSRFQPNIQIDYNIPDFATIAERIRRYAVNGRKKSFSIAKFSDLSPFEQFALIREIVSLLTIATLDDIEYLLRGLFSGVISRSSVKKVTSILVGSNHLVEFGVFGHYAINRNTKSVLEIRDGAVTAKEEIQLSLATAYLEAEREFLAVLTEARDAG